MGNNTPSNSGSTLGQFRDEFLDEGKQVVTDTVKGLVTEPAKILEQILGGKPNTGGDEAGTGESDPGQQVAQDPQAAAQKKAALLAQKSAADQNKSKQMHQILLKQIKDAEIQSVEEEKQKKKQEEETEEEEEKAKKQQVMQLQHEREKDTVMGGVIGQQQGSKEKKAWGAG